MEFSTSSTDSKRLLMSSNFHFGIRDASKHELVTLIETYDYAIKQANKNNPSIKIPTLEDLWEQQELERKRRQRL